MIFPTHVRYPLAPPNVANETRLSSIPLFFSSLLQAREKRMGPYRTMAQDIGNLAWDHHPQAPEFGPINHTKNFFDRSHLQCAGDEESIVPPRPRLR